MLKNQRFHTILHLVLIVLASYYLVPTILNFSGKKELLEKSQKPLPSYMNVFPEEEIKLGLDLRGGIYVEMEVQLEDAIRNRADLLAGEIKRITEKESFAPEKAEHLVDSLDIKVTLKKDEDLSLFEDWMKKNYGDTLQQKSKASKEVVYDLRSTYVDRVKELTVKQAVETVRNRIDRYGVTEPTIVSIGDNRISIELPGMTDPDRALNLIKKGGQLEFRLVDTSVNKDLVSLLTEAKKEAGFTKDPNEEWPKESKDFSEENLKLLNEKLKGKIPADTEIFFSMIQDPVSKKVIGGRPYLLKKKVEITGDMIRNAQVNIYENTPEVGISMNSLGAKLFADVTRNNIGKQLAIVLDGNVASAPNINSEIPNGEARITLGGGDDIMKEAEDLSLVLNEGSLPARLKELTKTVVGPSLGKDSIKKGVHISLISAILVILFMIIYYRVSGLFADIALTLNIFLMLAALAVFQATLTLPGIGGIVLTIGMAVDANVLIFERIREELRSGKSAVAALQAGYSGATSAILDSNITTFLAGVVLYEFGTGPIRGFAVTLMIGIVTTLYTSIITTRLLQEWMLYKIKKQQEISV